MEEKRWEAMEMDCLIVIFQRLSLEDMALSVPFVCRAWRKASIDPLCWKTLNFRGLDFMPWSQFTDRCRSRFAVPRFSFSGFLRLAAARARGSAVELRFPLLLRPSLQDLVFASDSCPRLKVLALPSVSLADEAQIPKLMRKWKQMEQLEMETKPSCFPEMAAEISLNCKCFSGLEMWGSIKKEDVTAIVGYLPAIKHLRLNRSYLPREHLVDLINGCRELESLSVDGCAGFEADEEVLKMASGIRSFSHEGCRLFVDFDCDFEDEFDPLHVLVI